MPEAKIIIIGAGPTGLGAAWRLQELGYGNWAVLGAGNTKWEIAAQRTLALYESIAA